MHDARKRTLTDGSPVTPDHREINSITGQQKGYVVLSGEDRAKGFVRPVRRSYVHVGRPCYRLTFLRPLVSRLNFDGNTVLTSHGGGKGLFG